MSPRPQHRRLPPGLTARCAVSPLLWVTCSLGVSTALAAVANSPPPVASEASAVHRLIRDGRAVQALQRIDKSLEATPDDPELRFQRGIALVMLDRLTEAIGVFQKLTEDHPELPAPYNNLAVLLNSKGEHDKAREVLERGMRANSAYAALYRNLGEVQAHLATESYNKALQAGKPEARARTAPKLALLRELTPPGPRSPVTAPRPPSASARAELPASAAIARSPIPDGVPVPALLLPVTRSSGAAAPGPASAATAKAPAPTTPPASAALTRPAPAQPLVVVTIPFRAPVLAGLNTPRPATIAASAAPAPALSARPASAAPVFAARPASAATLVAAAPAAAAQRATSASVPPAPAARVAAVPAPAPAPVAVLARPAPTVTPAASVAPTRPTVQAAASTPPARPAAPMAASEPARRTAVAASAPALAPAGGAVATAEASATSAIQSAVQAWASAWTRRDMPAYLGAYTADFHGQAADRAAWERERNDRIATRKQIRVTLSDVTSTVTGDTAVVRFRQTYASEVLSTTSRKTLTLRHSGGGKWLIQQEVSGN